VSANRYAYVVGARRRTDGGAATSTTLVDFRTDDEDEALDKLDELLASKAADVVVQFTANDTAE
jgi:hypothetical protein